MKYVRMKDMSYEWLTTFADYDNARNKATELGLTYSPKIVKQSDLIAELCDYVWYKEKHHEPMLERICYNVASVMKKPIVDGELEYVRLMILVGKDLKTVAEMNEKGELELL